MGIFFGALFESWEDITVALWKYLNWFGRLFVLPWFLPLAYLYLLGVMIVVSIKYRKEEADIK